MCISLCMCETIHMHKTRGSVQIALTLVHVETLRCNIFKNTVRICLIDLCNLWHPSPQHTFGISTNHGTCIDKRLNNFKLPWGETMAYPENYFFALWSGLGVFWGGLMPTMQWQRFILPLFFSECCSSSQPSARKHSPRRWHASRSSTTGVFSGIQKKLWLQEF